MPEAQNYMKVLLIMFEQRTGLQQEVSVSVSRCLLRWQSWRKFLFDDLTADWFPECTHSQSKLSTSVIFHLTVLCTIRLLQFTAVNKQQRKTKRDNNSKEIITV